MAFLESEVYGALAAARQALAEPLVLRCGRPRPHRERNVRGQHRAPLASLRAGRRDPRARPRLPGLPEHHRLRRRPLGRDRGHGESALPHRRARGRDGAHHGRRDRPNGLGDDRHRDQPDRAEDALRGPRRGPGIPWRGGAARRRSRHRHGAAGPRRPGRILHDHERAQVALRAQRKRGAARAQRPASRRAPIDHQPRHDLPAWGHHALPSRIRLDGDARSVSVVCLALHR